MAAASAKTDYSPAVPDPSTLVGPGGVEHHIVRVRGLPWSCTGDLFTTIQTQSCCILLCASRERAHRVLRGCVHSVCPLHQGQVHVFHLSHLSLYFHLKTLSGMDGPVAMLTWCWPASSNFSANMYRWISPHPLGGFLFYKV